MTTQEIFAKGQILTLEIAKSLKGRTIATTHPVYKMNKPTVTTFTVGEIVPQETLWANQDPAFIARMKESYGDVLELLDEKGSGTAIRLHKNYTEDTFTCSDVDREVYYVEVPEQKCIITHGTKGALSADGNWIFRPENQIKFAKVFNSVEEAIGVARTLKSSTGATLKTLQITWLTRNGDFIVPTVFAKVNNETGEIVRYGKN